jgi:hypothetical protein
MKKRLLTVLGTVVAVAGLAVTAAPATAGASPTSNGSLHAGPSWNGGAWSGWNGNSGPASDLSLVHGIPNLPVDIYVVKNFFSYKELPDVNYKAATDLAMDFPGWVTPGVYLVDVVPAGGNPFNPLLITGFYLGAGQSKTVVAYVTADTSGDPGQPTLGVFTNDVSPTGGAARVTVRHLAVAPTVGVYADGAVAITPSFSNGQTATAVVPAGSYDVTVTAPNTPGTVYDDLGPIAVGANTNTLAFAIGTFPSTFKVVALVVPTAS